MRQTQILPIVCWLSLAVLGMSRLWDYGSAPGEPGSAPASWPTEAGLALEPGLPNLLVFAHPQCPCTRASLRELERLLPRLAGPLSARVLFCVPPGSPPGFSDGALWEQAVALPGVVTCRDVDGRLAERFGAVSSGQVLVYDVAGALAYAGGLTGTRGHEGDNAGARAVLAALRGESAGPGTPALGCALLAPAAEPAT